MDEVKDVEQAEENNETPEQKAGKVQKQYNEEMAFLAKVLGGEQALVPERQLGGAEVATAVAKLFKQREEKLAEEVFQGLGNLLDQHMKDKATIREEKKRLEQRETEIKKNFVKVAKAWRSKINQQEVQKAEYAESLKAAMIEENKEEKC